MTKFLFVLCFLLFSTFVHLAHCDDEPQFTPIVQLKSGQVRGLVQQVDRVEQHFYQGIRYGVAKRFFSPTFAPSWTGVWNATDIRDSCPQPIADPATRLIQGESHSEDCLYLNIWKPANASKANPLPVIVWIHGGAFTIGSIFSISVDGKDLSAQGNVVLVAINYRLGPLGFLNTNEPNGSNFGLQDQILALKWVQENIAVFGGNPNLVTIAGESAGGQAVGALIVSPLAKNLFKKAILQSGAPNSGFQSRNSVLPKTIEFARKLHCTGENVASAVQCLRTKHLEEIINATSFTLGNDHFYPVYGDGVLPVRPQEAIKTGKFNKIDDILYGVCNNEGSYFARSLFPKLLTKETVTLTSAEEDIVHTMSLFNQTFGHEVAKLYLGRLPANFTQDEIKSAISDAIGDHRITCPTVLFSQEIFHQLAKNGSSVNFYSYRLKQHFQFPGFPEVSWAGVAHGEDLPFLFLVSFLSSPADKQLSRNMIKTWTFFASTGKPGSLKTANSSIEWTSALGEPGSSTQFMSLLADDYKMVPNYYQSTCEAFWKAKLFA